MKRLLLLVPLLLVACTSEVSDNTPTEPVNVTAINASDAGGQVIDPKQLAKLGETCGPKTEKICATGLSCQFEGSQQETGICLPTVVNPELECDETQAPVCGLLGNNKNGYLNECYARRYGAVVVNEGLCKPDPLVKNNCDARAYSLGNCEAVFKGAALNQKSGKCEAVQLVGCDADIPFESLEACEQACS